MERNGLLIHTKQLSGQHFEEGTKGCILVMHKEDRIGLHNHKIPLMVAPVHFSNFKNFHFRKWCVKKSETACSSYNIVEENDFRHGFRIYHIFGFFQSVYFIKYEIL